MSYTAPASGPLSTNGGSYGLQKASWKGIRKTLRRFGAKEHRTTGSHNVLLMKLPTGFVVATGKPGGGNKHDTLLAQGINQLMSEIVNAKLEPVLFLAMLEREGCSWHQRPRDVSLLSKYLKEHSWPSLTNPSKWRAVLKDFAAQLQRKPEPEEAPQIEAQEADMTTQTEPKKTPKSPPMMAYKTKDVLDLAGVEDGARQRAGVWVGSHMREGTGPLAELIEQGHAGQVARGSQMHNRFTEEGAIRLAQEIVKRYGSSDDDAPVEKVEAPTEEAEAEATLPAEAEVAAEPTVRVVEGGKTTLRPAGSQRPAEPLTLGPAIMRLCQHHAVEPQWYGGGATIDLEATVIELARALK